MNLHEWITARVDVIEAAARAATLGPWEAVVDHHQHGEVNASVWADDIGYYITEKINSGVRHEADAHHIALHNPAAVLHRCEADRRVLARHRMNPDGTVWYDAAACHGCGTYGDLDTTVTDNINDCPELLDLAHAHGITEDQLAALDRPEPTRPDAGPVIGHATVTPVITPDQVPAALRGVRWRRHRH